MKFEEGHIYFNKIVIIQSLPFDERQTGTEIHDDYLIRNTWQDPSLSVELLQIKTKGEFTDCLSMIEQDTRMGQYLPFIHFETHGGLDGICISSGEYIIYQEFIDIIRKININTKNNLFISVGACWGGRIQFETDVGRPCPFRGFIGPMDIIYPEDLVISFSNFFDELLKTNDFDLAINRLNQYNNSGVEFHHYNAEAFFEELTRIKNIWSFNNGDIIDKLVTSEVRKRWDKDRRIRQKFRTRDRFRSFIRSASIKLYHQSYQKLRDNFLHIKIRE